MDLPVVLVEKENFGTRPLSIPILERKYCVITLYLLLDNVSKGKQYLSMKTLRAFSWFMCLPFVPKKQPAVDPLKLIGPKKVFFGSSYIVSSLSSWLEGTVGCW